MRHGTVLADQVRDLAAGGVDAVLHVAGPQTLDTTPMVARTGARVATVAGGPGYGATQVFARLRDEDLAAVVGLAEAGTLTVRSGSVHPFAEAPAAHRLVEFGGASGEVVLVPSG